MRQGNHKDNENLLESLVLIGRQFKKMFKHVDIRSRFNGQNNGQIIRSNIDNQTGKGKMTKTDEKSTQYKGVQCHECEGYGHIRTKCATFLKRQKKSLAVSWSDGDDSVEDVESESTKHLTTLTGRIMSDTESYDEELSYDELVISYNELIAKNADMSQMLEKQENIISQLQVERSENLAKISELNDEVTQLNS